MAAETPDPNPSPLLPLLASMAFVAVSGLNSSLRVVVACHKAEVDPGQQLDPIISEVFPMILTFYYSMHMGRSWILAISSLRYLQQINSLLPAEGYLPI